MTATYKKEFFTPTNTRGEKMERREVYMKNDGLFAIEKQHGQSYRVIHVASGMNLGIYADTLKGCKERIELTLAYKDQPADWSKITPDEIFGNRGAAIKAFNFLKALSK